MENEKLKKSNFIAKTANKMHCLEMFEM